MIMPENICIIFPKFIHGKCLPAVFLSGVWFSGLWFTVHTYIEVDVVTWNLHIYIPFMRSPAVLFILFITHDLFRLKTSQFLHLETPFSRRNCNCNSSYSYSIHAMTALKHGTVIAEYSLYAARPKHILHQRATMGAKKTKSRRYSMSKPRWPLLDPLALQSHSTRATGNLDTVKIPQLLPKCHI